MYGDWRSILNHTLYLHKISIKKHRKIQELQQIPDNYYNWTANITFLMVKYRYFVGTKYKGNKKTEAAVGYLF